MFYKYLCGFVALRENKKTSFYPETRVSLTNKTFLNFNFTDFFVALCLCVRKKPENSVKELVETYVP